MNNKSLKTIQFYVVYIYRRIYFIIKVKTNV